MSAVLDRFAPGTNSGQRYQDFIAHMQTDEGIWYPMGGTRAVPVALEKLARELGVEIHTHI